MSVIILKADKKSIKLLSKLAERLGGTVLKVSDEQYEDFLLGAEMENAKTGKTVSRARIFKILNSK